MSLRLVRAKKEDIPQLVDLYFNTFKSPLVLRAKPNIPQVREWYTKNLESDIEKPHMRIYKLVENQPESGSESIIAFGKWSSPHKESPEEKAFEYPEGAEPALWEEVIGKVTEKKKQIMGDEEFWYLSVMGTLPQHQRKGAGSFIMTEFCKQADETGHRSYLEASPSGKSTYERFGFKTKDSFSTSLDGEPYFNYCMVREPQKRE